MVPIPSPIDDELHAACKVVLSNDKDIKQLAATGAFTSKKVLLRLDLNVPLFKSGDAWIVSDDSRILATLPTIRLLLDGGARVIAMSHLGRPKAGKPAPEFSLAPVAQALASLLGPAFVGLAPSAVGSDTAARAAALSDGQLLLLENTRFHAGDEAGDVAFAKELASLADVYVNDAFGASHRAHGSVSVLAQFFAHDARYPGLLLRKEVKYLSEAMWDARRPLACVIGGAKVSDKLGVLSALVRISDVLLIGGKMAFTFLAAQGISVGDTAIELDKICDAKRIMEEAAEHNCRVVLPHDCLVSASLDRAQETEFHSLEAACCSPDHPCVHKGTYGVDIGPDSSRDFAAALAGCSTVFWNGPMGKFEVPEFAEGTRAVAHAIELLSAEGAISIVGGGDSVAAINQLGLASLITHISTGGGAALELIEGRAMPGITCLV